MWCSIILILAVFGQHANCESTLDDKYFLGQDSSSYSQSIQTCESRGMKLASIESKEKNDEISELMRQKDIQEGCWVSGRTLPDRRSWVWLDGKPVEYENWNPTRKHLLRHVLTDNCITVARHRGQLYWDDQFCPNRRCYICEHPRSECNQHQISVRVDDHLNGTNAGAQTRRRKEFYISRTGRSFRDATRTCQDLSMELLSIYNEAENQEVADLLGTDTTRFWTSGHKNSSADPWQWSFDKNISYYSWRSGEPNNAGGTEFCIFAMKENNEVRWSDHYCSVQHRFICQTVIPKVDIFVNGEQVVYRGLTKDRVTVPSQERPFQVYVDVKSVAPTDTRKHFVWNYFISDDKVRQSDARMACENRSEHLLTIENKDKNEKVYTLLEKNQVRGVYWTSATRKFPTQLWRWGNGDPIMYFHWGLRSFIPTTLGDTCMVIHKTEMDVTWSDLPCNDTRQYICESTYVHSENSAGGILLDVSYDNSLVYSNDSTGIVTRY